MVPSVYSDKAENYHIILNLIGATAVGIGKREAENKPPSIPVTLLDFFPMNFP